MSPERQFIDAQAASYRDPSPEQILEQLNRNWTQLRVFKRAVGDRDRLIATLNLSLADREEVIAKLKTRLTFGRTVLAVIYAAAAGAAGATVKELSWSLIQHLRH